MTMSGDGAYARLLAGLPMDIKDVLAALDHVGGFSYRRSKKKPHYIISREGHFPYTLGVRHNGEVKGTWLQKMVRHFGLDEEE